MKTNNPEINVLRIEARASFQRRDFAKVVEIFDLNSGLGDIDPVVGLLASESLVELGQRPRSVECMMAAVKSDRSGAIEYAVELYLTRRRKTADGAGHEDGWIRMLDVLIESGLLRAIRSKEELRSQSTRLTAELTIPKKIVQFWDKRDVPGEVVDCIDTVKHFHPDYQHQLFCEEDGRALVIDVLGQGAAVLFDACPHSAAKSDFFRAAYLYRHGGVYVDADERAIGGMDEFLDMDTTDLLLSYSVAEVSCVNNWFACARPNHPLVERALEIITLNLSNIVDREPDTNVWVMTGPGAWTFATLDTAIDMANNNPTSLLKDGTFIDESIYRQIFVCPPMEYKNSAEGNWRLL